MYTLKCRNASPLVSCLQTYAGARTLDALEKNIMQIKAYSYSRYSSEKQKTSQSISRQIESTQKFISENGWLYKEQIIDRGISARDGSNISKGALGHFLEDVKSGRIETPCVLVVEKLDRVTRLKLKEAQNLIGELLENNVTIATTMNGRIIKPEDANDFESILMVLFELKAAFDYSDNISKRVKDAWANKKQNASKGLRNKDTGEISDTVPFWIKIINKKDPPKCFSVIKKNAEIVNRIFQEYKSGESFTAISDSLNSDKIAPPSQLRSERKYKNKRSGKGEPTWCDKSVKMTLKNVAVIGNYQPRNHLSKKARTDDGAEVENYYPSIITKDEFQYVQALIERRKGILGPRKGINNLFTNLIICEKCGWNVGMNSARKADYYWKRLGCNGHRQKQTDCKTKMNYDHFEDAVISAFILELLGSIYKPNQSKALIKAKAELVQKKSNYEKINTQLDEMRDSGIEISTALNNSAKRLEDDIRKLESAVEVIPRKDNWNDPTQIELLHSGEVEPLTMNVENRAMVRDIFKTIIKQIVINFEDNTIKVFHNYSDFYIAGRKGGTENVGPRIIKLDYDSRDEGWHPYKSKYPKLFIKTSQVRGDFNFDEYRDNLLWQ